MVTGDPVLLAGWAAGTTFFAALLAVTNRSNLSRGLTEQLHDLTRPGRALAGALCWTVAYGLSLLLNGHALTRRAEERYYDELKAWRRGTSSGGVRRSSP
jgi:hypothetical protein